MSNVVSNNRIWGNFRDPSQACQKGVSQYSLEAEKMATLDEERPKLNYKHSMVNLKEGKPLKKLINDREHNNPESVKMKYVRPTKSLEGELNQILHSKELTLLFRQWLKTQRCDENLSFWVEVELMRTEVEDGIDLAERANSIYEKYLAPNASSPVNLDSEFIKEVERLLKEGNVEVGVYDDLQHHVYRLMETDSVRRFLQSTEYTKYTGNLRGVPLTEIEQQNLQMQKKLKLRLNHITLRNHLNVSTERLDIGKKIQILISFFQSDFFTTIQQKAGTTACKVEKIN